jgi:hypothetical protein
MNKIGNCMNDLGKRKCLGFKRRYEISWKDRGVVQKYRGKIQHIRNNTVVVGSKYPLSH